jgi:hypothetical protein
MTPWLFAGAAVLNVVLCAIALSHGKLIGWLYAGTSLLWVAGAVVQFRRERSS